MDEMYDSLRLQADDEYLDRTTRRVHAIRQLDERVGDGHRVELLWDPITDTIGVVVYDADQIVLKVPVYDRQKAQDVFNHPYAYAQ
jgi:hypothetical protein